MKTGDLVTADFAGNSSWGDDDPSVFAMKIVGTLQGEFQLTNGYGKEKAIQVLRVRESYQHIMHISSPLQHQ